MSESELLYENLMVGKQKAMVRLTSFLIALGADEFIAEFVAEDIARIAEIEACIAELAGKIGQEGDTKNGLPF